MDRIEIREIDPPANMSLQISAEPCLAALSEQYATRGLARSAQIEAEEQIKREAETVEMAPDSYRMSAMSEGMIRGCCRNGKDYMNTLDLIGYFADTRQGRIQNADFEGNTGIDRCTGSSVKIERALVESSEKERGLSVGRALEQIKRLPEIVKTGIPTWFDTDDVDSSREKKRFPLSAFAAVMAVAASLMLIVASSVLLILSEKNVSRLQRDVSDMSAEVIQLNSDFEADVDLLQIRQIATEEYGMVEEDYVKMDYITLSDGDTVEAFDEERGSTAGLSALLSAIGIKK